MLGPVLNESDVYREWAPPPAWTSVVTCCWEQRVVVPRVQRVVPDARADVLVRETGDAQVVGLADEVALVSLPAGTRIRGIRIRPEAVAPAFGVTASELRNRTVDAADVVGARRSRVLVDERSIDEWIRSIEPDARAARAVRLLDDLTVDTTAAALGLSPRQLRRIFEVNVGVGPKSFQRVRRFQRFLQQAEAGVPLASAAAEAGYSDQAHMSRDVLGLSGLTPSRLVAERTGG
jgi:AraC-like DNA-binding protein